MRSKDFWWAVFERALKTFATTLLTLWAGTAGFDIMKTNVTHALSLAGGAAVLSVLLSIASAGVGNKGPSLATEAVVPAPPAA